MKADTYKNRAGITRIEREWQPKVAKTEKGVRGAKDTDRFVGMFRNLEGKLKQERIRLAGIAANVRKIRQSADHQDRACPAVTWWRALMITALTTGLRINQMLTLRWGDVQLDERLLIVRHDRNKAKQDDVVPLHPGVVEHLRKLTDVGQLVFDWPFQLQAVEPLA